MTQRIGNGHGTVLVSGMGAWAFGWHAIYYSASLTGLGRPIFGMRMKVFNPSSRDTDRSVCLFLCEIIGQCPAKLLLRLSQLQIKRHEILCIVFMQEEYNTYTLCKCCFSMFIQRYEHTSLIIWNLLKLFHIVANSSVSTHYSPYYQTVSLPPQASRGQLPPSHKSSPILHFEMSG